MKHDRIEIWPEVPPAGSHKAFVGSLRKSWAGDCAVCTANFNETIRISPHGGLRPVEAQRCRQVFWKLREVIPQVILFPEKKTVNSR